MAMQVGPTQKPNISTTTGLISMNFAADIHCPHSMIPDFLSSLTFCLVSKCPLGSGQNISKNESPEIHDHSEDSSPSQA